MNKYIFICKHNFTRSKFGAEFFRGYLRGKKIKGKVYSAGIGFGSIFLGKRINKKYLIGTDYIFVMEKYMKDHIIKKFNFDSKKIIVLNILDDYGLFEKKSIRDLDKKFRKINWNKYL